jgi:hypothetical protein
MLEWVYHLNCCHGPPVTHKVIHEQQSLGLHGEVSSEFMV